MGRRGGSGTHLPVTATEVPIILPGSSATPGGEGPGGGRREAKARADSTLPPPQHRGRLGHSTAPHPRGPLPSSSGLFPSQNMRVRSSGPASPGCVTPGECFSLSSPLKPGGKGGWHFSPPFQLHGPANPPPTGVRVHLRPGVQAAPHTTLSPPSPPPLFSIHPHLLPPLSPPPSLSPLLPLSSSTPAPTPAASSLPVN